MIRLYNKTGWSDETLRFVLQYAQRRMDVKGDVVVKVTQRWGTNSSGEARNGYPYLWHLSSTRVKGKRRRRMIGKQYGWCSICIPDTRIFRRWKEVSDKGQADHITNTILQAARSVLYVAKHEMAHIAQFRSGAHFASARTASGRRVSHDKRPIEIDAENRIYDARPRTQRERDREQAVEMVIALMFLESNNG